MVEGALAALARTGGTALVAGMATGAWPASRSAAALLFGRGGAARRNAIEALLDASAVVVAKAEDTDQARRSLILVWRLELEALLRRYPEVQGELRDLVAQVHDALPAPQRRWAQTMIAHDD